MSVPAYLKITPRGSAFARLVCLKNSAAYTNAPDVNLPPSRRFADWRAARTQTFRTITPELSQGLNTSDNGPLAPRRPVWFTFNPDVFRDERYADAIAPRSIGHNGWYCDIDQSATIRGIVGRLTHGRYIAGTYASENGEYVYFDRIYTDEKEAAHAADSEAERAAEQEREHAERFQAASVMRDDIAQHEKDIAELFPLRNESARVRADLYAELQGLRVKRATLADEFNDIEF